MADRLRYEIPNEPPRPPGSLASWRPNEAENALLGAYLSRRNPQPTPSVRPTEFTPPGQPDVYTAGMQPGSIKITPGLLQGLMEMLGLSGPTPPKPMGANQQPSALNYADDLLKQETAGWGSKSDQLRTRGADSEQRASNVFRDLRQ